jgi:hypothetical protein|tara:strand:+ start:814 stop:1242 length:429 start_codon:yes stop_codon:yes gene_type:complete
MEKFLKLNIAGSGADSGFKLIPINNIMEIKQESITVIQIFYQNIASAGIGGGGTLSGGGDGTIAALTQESMVQSLKITLASDAYDSFSWKNFLNDSIETAMTLSWQHPVFTPGAYPKSAASGNPPTTISSIVTGVKLAGIQS